MPFGDYKTLASAIVDLQVAETYEDFVQLSPLPVSDYFRPWLAETLTNYPVNCSEWAVCESLIYPVLREVSRPYVKELVICSHVPLYQGEQFLGVPDYIIGRRSPLSVGVVGPPLVMIIEAKRNDFDAGWGQCLGAMAGALRMSPAPERIVYGCVSDGFIWRFGRLQGQTLIRHRLEFTLSRLDELFAAWNYVMEQCRQQALLPAEAA